MLITSTITLLELIWVIINVIGLFFTMWESWEAYKDIQYLKASGKNGFRKLVAKSALFGDVGRAFVMWLFFALGIDAMTQPNPAAPLTFQYVFYVSVFILSAVILVVKSYEIRRTRYKVKTYHESNSKPGSSK